MNETSGNKNNGHKKEGMTKEAMETFNKSIMEKIEKSKESIDILIKDSINSFDKNIRE